MEATHVKCLGSLVDMMDSSGESPAAIEEYGEDGSYDEQAKKPIYIAMLSRIFDHYLNRSLFI